MQRSAECACGLVKIVTSADPERVGLCHCFDCQKRTGSIFGVQARFANGVVTIIGETKKFTRIGDDGQKIDFNFCTNCGSTTHYSLSGSSSTGIPVGLFTNPDFPIPSFEIYTNRRHPWVTISDSIANVDP